MNKFTKIKKALAVSLCSSMLFSGKPKVSAMDSIVNKIADNKGFFCAAAIVAALSYFKVFQKINNSIDITKNIKAAKVIYNKICYLLNKNELINQQQFTVPMKQHITACLNNANFFLREAEGYEVFSLSFNGNSLSFFDFDKSKELKIKSEGKKNDSIKGVIISLRQLQGLVNNVGFDDNVNIDLNDNNILIGNATNAIERLRVYVNTLLNQQNQISENMLRDAGNNSSIAQVPDLFHPPVQLPIGP